MTPDSLNTLIKSRRSIFQNDFTGEKVPAEIIRQVLENANWAPTHKLTEPWRFVVYSGEGLQKLATLQAEFYKKITTEDHTFKEERYQNLLTKPLLSSHIIVVGMKRDPKHAIPEIEEVGAVFCAVQNMYLTLPAYNLAGYLSTGGITYFKNAQLLFGWGPEDKLIGFFHIGFPKREYKATSRKPVDEKILWIEG